MKVDKKIKRELTTHEHCLLIKANSKITDLECLLFWTRGALLFLTVINLITISIQLGVLNLWI